MKISLYVVLIVILYHNILDTGPYMLLFQSLVPLLYMYSYFFLIQNSI